MEKQLHHLMFDIDGTLIQSNDVDSICFVDAVRKVTGKHIDSDWGHYQNVTDSGILNEVLSDYVESERSEIIKQVKAKFIQELRKSIGNQAIEEVPGARAFLSHLKSMNNVVISIATGGWYESATLKLQSAGFEFSDIPFASSNDHPSRTDIMKTSQFRAVSNADYPCTYFGDGAWDKKASNELGFGFVLVGNKLKHQPSIVSYEAIDEILGYIEL